MMIHTFVVLEERDRPQCRVYAQVQEARRPQYRVYVQVQGVRPNVLHFGGLKFTCDSARGGKAAV